MKFLIIAIFALLSNISIYSQSLDKTNKFSYDSLFLKNYDPLEDLVKDINNLINIPELFNANIGVSIYSISKNQYIYNLNQNKNFIPASLLKLFTSYSGLFFLGKNYSTFTEFYTNGIVNKKGVLLGDLVVRSNGNLAIKYSNYESVFSDLVASLDSVGIKSIKGNLVIDNSYFDNVYYPLGWAIDDIKYNYSAQISAVNFNNNIIDIHLNSDAEIGELAKFESKPSTNYVTIENNVQVVGENGESNVYFDRYFSSNVIKIWGKLKNNDYVKKPYRIEVSIDNPALYFANVLYEYLSDNNIRINGNIIEHTIEDNNLDYSPFYLMAMNQGETIEEIIKQINSKSDNLYSEILLKLIGKEKTGVGSIHKGLEQIHKLAEDIGIPSSGLKLYDGSGLSRLNLISPSAIIRLLNYVAAQKDFNTFRSSLSRPNEKGTLKNRFKGTNAEKKIWAKTGSMNYVNNIAGYIISNDGEMFSFAICFNNYTTPSSTIRNIQDLILMRLSSFERTYSKN